MYQKTSYTKIQQYISYLLIFSIFFLNTFQIPILEKTSAESASDTQIVSIIVSEDVYSSISSELKTYVGDIQSKLNNTKAIIYKVPKDILPQKLAVLNEKLYFQGDSIGEGSSKNSRLVGTILVGNIPLPVIHNQQKTFLSVYPYIDFNQKNFIYNNETGFYEVSNENKSNPNPEIWHSVISPNTGDESTDKIKLKEFFKKDHEFYEKSGVFSKSLEEPYVFYYDGKRDTETSSYTLRKGYDLYLKNIEDIAYNRYNKYLAKKVADLFYGNTQSETSNLFKDAGAANSDLLQYVNINLGNSSPDVTSTPDVMTKKIIEAVTKQFFQVFNEKYLGDILKFVHNTGRYGDAKNTRVDTMISSISKRDNAMKRILKDINTSVEGMVDDMLKKGLARNIALPVKVEEAKHYRFEHEDCTSTDNGDGTFTDVCNTVCHDGKTNPDGDGYNNNIYSSFEPNGYKGVLENFYYGIIGSNVKSALDCSFYRGTRRVDDNKSVLVEATRAYDLSQQATDADSALLQTSPNAQTCFPAIGPLTMAFWGGYSIFNIDGSTTGASDGNMFKLKSEDFRRATRQIYDIKGGKQIGYNKDNDNQDIKTDVAGNNIETISTNSCIKYNWLYTNPNNLNPPQGRCDSAYSSHQAPYSYDPYNGNKFEEIYKLQEEGKVYFSASGSYSYHNRYLYLDGAKVKDIIGDKGDCTHYIIYSNYYFKKLLGIVEHKSPTDAEFGAQLQNMTTPSLPSDRNRYVDFVSAKGNQKKFEYPNLFRIVINNSKDLTYTGAQVKLKEYLDKKSQELNTIITSENPATLAGLDKEIYEKLKVDNAKYPNKVDFYSFLSQDPKVLDEAIKNVLWNNLNAIDIKYQYVFEHYLDIDGNSPSLDTAHRSDYEIVYLGGKGDSNNMFVRLDPEKSKENITNEKVKNVISKFATFKNTIAASKITTDNDLGGGTAEFKCGPPDGVPIFQWISAIMCRLKTLVPPVSIESGKCSSSTLGENNESEGEFNFGEDIPTITNPIFLEDRDKNGIIDGAELIDKGNGGEINLMSDKGMYSHNSSIKLKANLLNDNKLIAVDSSSKVEFDIIKITSLSGSESKIVYDSFGDQEILRDKKNISTYVNFSPSSVKVSKGVANYAFSSKHLDVDVVLRAKVSTKDKNGEIKVSNTSNDLIVQIRGVSIGIVIKGYLSDGTTSTSNNIEAGEVTKLEFNLKTLDKNNKPYSNNFTPFKLDIIDSATGEKLLSGATVQDSSYTYSGDILKKSGSYKFIFTDKYGIQGTYNVNVNPGKIGNIKITPSSTQFVVGSEVDLLVELFDSNNNRITGELYNLKGKISGPGVFSDIDNELNKDDTRGILEGYTNFKLKSDGGSGKIKLNFSIENTSISKDIEIEAIESAKVKIKIENEDNIIVGGQKHKISLEVLEDNESGRLLDKFNGVAYFDFPEINGAIANNFVRIKNGKSEDSEMSKIYLFPGIVASKNIKINLTVPGIKKVEGNIITILPEKPMYLGLINTKPKIEAKQGNKSTIKASLFDRYGNITFNDSNHSIKFEIPEEYKKSAEFSGGVYTKTINATDGVAKIDVIATDIPGTSFILGEVTPSLESNSFIQKDDNGGQITIKGISENAVAFDTYYLFNKEKVDKLDYNGLYTVLQGADYGNITRKQYLAGEILFNKTGRSLAVSSVLNNPYFRDVVFGFTPGGKFISNDSGSKENDFMLETDISTTSQGTALNLYDSVYKDLIARAWFNFDNNTELIDCKSSNDLDISKCSIPKNNTFIVVKGVGDVDTVTEGNSVSIMLNNFKIFTVDSRGRITKDPGVSFEIDSDSIGNMFGVKLIMNQEQIGYFGIKFNTNLLSVKDSDEFPNILATTKNQIVLERMSTDYYFDNNYLGVSSRGAKGIMFYKTNEESDEIDKELVSDGEKSGLENYSEEEGIGWSGTNKMLLEFAGGNNIGDSTKFYQTYSMINLGDPVVYLNTQKAKDSDFDKSIGKRILEEQSMPIESYDKIDFNGDGLDEMVAFYEDGRVELLANYKGNFKNMGFLALIYDAGKGRKGTGDFKGDKYDDIIFIDKNGNLGMLQNIKGKFTRVKPIIQDIDSKIETQINGDIQQMEIFDMDKDGKQDLVIIDDSGELYILYGTDKKVNEINTEQIFYKKVLDDSLGMTLSSKTTKNGGAIYFDSLPQIGDFQDQSKQILESQQLKANYDGGSNNTDEALKSQLDRLIYYQERYQEYSSGTLTQEEREKIIYATAGTDEEGNLNTEVADDIIKSQNDLMLLNGSGMTNIDSANTQAIEKTRTFLRSQFAEAHNLEIEKSYSDVNKKYLQSGDLIDVVLKIKNNSSNKLNNVIYYDSNENFLQSEDNSVYELTTRDGIVTKPLKKKEDTEFSLVFDGFSISAGDTAIIKYKMIMPPVSFGKISVGILKDNDKYGDVALSPNNVCGEDQLMWYSNAARNYLKGLQKFEDKTKLPEELEKNKKDDNNNGIPDYIEELQNDQNKLKKYSNEKIQELKKDSNGNTIPDDSDNAGSSIFDFDGDSGEISIGGLSSENLDAIDSQIDDFVNQLGCGFGGGACIAMPMNWAPLAPGSSPTIFGIPVTPNLMRPSAGLPIFSLLTGLRVGPRCIPSIWPVSPLALEGCATLGAGGMLGTNSPSNFLRIFVTPTITGAVGTAICFGGPAMAMGQIPPVGLSPMIPGGNCIIAAKPLIGCNDDGSDGDIGSQGFLNTSTTGSGKANSFFNAGSCTKPGDIKTTVGTGTTQNIISYIKGDSSKAKDIMNDPMVQHGGINPDSGPMIGMSTPWGSDGDSLDISIDSSAIANLDLSNIIKIDYKRVSAFPDFIMDWITRQLEEIVNKLTTLPTLYIILPDFSGLADSGWTKFGDKLKQALDKIKKDDKKQAEKNEKEQQKAEKKVDDLKNSGSRDAQKYINEKKAQLKNVTANAKEGLQGIRAAYEVIGNLPLISIQNEQVDINIPWIGVEDIDKWIEDAKGKVEKYEKTIDDTTKKWESYANDPTASGGLRLLLDANKLVSSIQQNINTLEEYKKFPSKLRKYIKWKEHFINQILCNIEIINKVTGERIYTNGKRFRAWVELIVLLKAILKSWQAIVDIFIDFNANCSVCHIERYNLMYWIMKLISALIPKLPIIQFPKWPDIIIDLHNIRAGLNILMPEFNFKVVPIVLPQLPDLKLPDTPKISVKFSLPSIPTLPSLPDLPDLPDLPSLPEVKLPDLPPPPKIPDIFGVIKAAISLLKLIAKVICLWRKIGNLLPPEWRSGDAIAWMTERNGVLPIDKLFIDFPDIAIPFVDAIKVTSYVNLEFDVDFIVEMAKSTLEPFNKFSSDMSNLSRGFNIPDIDLSEAVPTNINIDVKLNPDGSVKSNLDSYVPKNNNELLSYIGALAGFTISGILQVVKGIQDNTKERDLVEFKKLLKKDISSLAFSSNEKEKRIYDILTRAIDFNASNENKFISNLINNNNEKFQVLKDILNKEKEKNNSLNKELLKIENGQNSVKDFSPIKISNYGGIKAIGNYIGNDYQKFQEKQFNSLEKSLNNLSNLEEDPDSIELKNGGEEIINKVKLGIKSFKEEALEGILPKVGTGIVDRNYASSNDNTSGSQYSYSYEGIYVINSAGKQTRLFEYLDEIDDNSNIVELDYDNDGDIDVMYKMREAIYIKENLKNKPNITHISDIENVKDISDINDYLLIKSEADKLPFAPNFFEEVIATSKAINFKFLPANQVKENSYRLEYYDYIDRFDRTNNNKDNNIGMTPESKINFVDMVTSMNDDYIINTPEGLVKRNNFATIDSGIGDDIDIVLSDYEILTSGKALLVQEGKIIYAGEAGAQIEYKFEGDSDYRNITLEPNTNLEFLETANITIKSGSIILVYGSYKEYNGDINNFKGVPVLPGAKINLKNSNQKAIIKYVGGQELKIDNNSSYRMLFLGEKSESYSVAFDIPNSFYYGKMYEFSGNRKSNITDLTLMSPQFESDTEAPLVSVDSGIRVPVYQKQTINLKKYINEVSGVKNIYIDFDIEKDTSGDLIIDNDKDTLESTSPYYSLVHKGNTIYDLQIGPFDYIFNKKVMLYVVDDNENISASLIDFEVYAPIPKIEKAGSGIIEGLIDEELSGEPIDIFRFRNGLLELIKPKSNSITKTNEKGLFSIETDNVSEGLVIKKNKPANEMDPGIKDQIIANINEDTGKIDLKDTNYTINIKGASGDKRTTLQIVDKSKGNIIYEQSFNLSANQVIQTVSSFDNTSKGIFYKNIKDGYKLVNNSSVTPSLAAGAFIVDNNSNAIVGIGQDGNIYIMNESYKLSYDSNGDNIMINVTDESSNQIGSFLFKVNLEFVVK